MRILGIDPGIARTGWGTVTVQSLVLRQRSGQEFKIQNYGCIETASTIEMHTRLKLLHEKLSEIIENEKPDVIVIEDLFFNTNAKTALIVGQARGVVLLTAAENCLPVAVYTPLQIKVALTGYGRAEKRQIGKMVQIILKLSEIPKPDDTADALAIALTHGLSAKSKSYHL